MKLESKESPSFSLFNPSDNCLPTEERTQFRSRADDVFAGLSRDSIAPSELSSSMAPPPPPRSTSPRCVIDQVNIGPSPELYASLVSDKAAPVNSDKRDKRPRGFDSNKRCFRAQHEIHPNKFTKYTLRDTDLTDDKQNKTVALGFLTDLNKNKVSQETECTAVDKKITFSKRDGSTPQQEEDQCSSSVPPPRHKSAIVQEEYVVGQTKSVSKRKAREGALQSHAQSRSIAASSNSSSKLKGKGRGNIVACYLEEEEEEED